MKDNRSIKDRLKEVGIIVTDFFLNNKRNRLLIDEKGNELGYFTPLKALKKYL